MKQTRGSGADAHRPDFRQMWLAPIVTGLIAFLSATGLAWRQEAVSDTRTYRDLRIKHADSSVQAMADYVLQWRRLIVQCRQSLRQEQDAANRAGKGLLTNDEREALKLQRKSVQETALGRRPKRERLVAELDMLRLYFSAKVDRQIAAFRRWDEANEAKGCDEMPAEGELTQHQSQLVDLLRAEVR